MRVVMVFFLALISQISFANRVSVPGEWLVKANGKYQLVKSQNPPRLSRGISSVQPNYLYRSETLDPDLGKSWALKNFGQAVSDSGPGIPGKDISAEEAWRVYDGSYPVTIAVLDSGIDLNHPELRRMLWKNSREIPANGKDDDGNGYADDVNGWDFVNAKATPQDDNNHGTFCSGIIGAEADNGVGARGVARGAQIMALKMLDNLGEGTTASAIAAIEYAVKEGAKILNISWGGSTYDPALYEVFREAGKKGVLFVVAAGNQGSNNDGSQRVNYPAAFRLPSILSVAAYDNRDEIARWSNYGKETVHLGAPGVDIFSTVVGGYKIGEGTSYAAPYVTGVAALVKSANPELSAAELKDRLLWTSEPLHYYDLQKILTGGRVNAFHALTNFRPPRLVPPTQWTSFADTYETPHPYLNQMKESFRFYRQGAKHVRVHFTKFDTESCCDRLILKDSAGKQVAEYSGVLGDFWSADALGDTIQLEFISDFVTTSFGIAIDQIQASY